MKVKVNPITGMVALVAGKGILNQKEGRVFGALPKDAARLLASKAASVFDKLPDLPKGESWNEVDINVDKGIVGATEKGAEKAPEAKPAGNVGN